MPKAVFFVKQTMNKWRPPFGKVVTNNEASVEEGQQFDEMEKPKGYTFKLVRCDTDRALVEFNRLFDLKGHEHPANRRVWVGKIDEINFTYLWGEDGITKSLLLKETDH